MAIFFINTLSAHNQCKSHEETRAVLVNIVECLKIIAPSVKSGMNSLMIDDRIHSGLILNGENLYGVFSSIRGTTELVDAKKLWFLYTNRAQKAKIDSAQISLSNHPHSDGSSVAGESSVDMLNAEILISLGGSSLMNNKELNMEYGGENRIVQNVYDRQTTSANVLIYEENPKHRKEQYYDFSRNEIVAPMTLQPDIAQNVLLNSKRFHDDYFGVHHTTGKIIRFKQTLGNKYHGFEINKSELPTQLLNPLGLA